MPAPGGQFVLHARTLPGNPYDGHTLGAVIEATERLTGRKIERASVDSLALYAANGTKLVCVTPNIDLSGLSAALNNNGASAVSLPADLAVLVRVQTQQVPMVIRDHFVVK